MVEFIFPKDARPHSAEEIGLALAGLVSREPSGLPKVGMLGDGPTVDAVAASWKVEIGRFVYVHQSDGAVQLSGMSASTQLDITSAVGMPAGNSRIDRVCWNPTTGQLIVVEGVAASSPAAPSIGVNAPVARVTVKYGDGMVIGAQVVSEFVVTGLASAKRVAARSSVVHSLPSNSHAGRTFNTGLVAVPFDRLLTVGNGDVTANNARFELPNNLLPSGATSVSVAWIGGHAGMARMNFVAVPVEV